MSKFSDEQRHRIVAETRAILQRGQAERVHDTYELPPAEDEDLLLAALSAPLESTNDRHRREIEQEERRWARRREREQSTQQRVLANRIDQAIETLRGEMRREIEAVRADLLDVVLGCVQAVEQIDGTLDHLAREPARAASERVEALFKRMEERLDEIAPPRGTAVDLPPLPLRGSRAN